MSDEVQERVWVTTMAPNKLVLRLPAKAKNVISWLATERSIQEVQCAVLVGKHGQLIVKPLTALSAGFDEVQNRLEETPAELGDERSDWFEIARLAAAARPSRIMVEQGGRASLYLPRALCIGTLGPSMGEKAVIVAIGAVLEVWTLAAWSKWLVANGQSADPIA
jgi:hypothetical protein